MVCNGTKTSVELSEVNNFCSAAIEVDQGLKAGATHSYRSSNFSGILTIRSVFIKSVLERIVVLYPHEHQITALHKVVYCYKDGKKKVLSNGREMDHHKTQNYKPLIGKLHLKQRCQ